MKYQRIEDMRIDQDLTIKEISALLECNRDVYSRYEKGIRDIPIDYVIRLARFYDCSVDYLLSVSSKKRKFGDYFCVFRFDTTVWSYFIL